MFGLAVYVKKRLPFPRDLFFENSEYSYLCFQQAVLHSVSYFFFLYLSPSSSVCTDFDAISFNIDEVRLIKYSANAFAFWDFTVLYKDCLVYSSGTDKLV